MRCLLPPPFFSGAIHATSGCNRKHQHGAAAQRLCKPPAAGGLDDYRAKPVVVLDEWTQVQARQHNDTNTKTAGFSLLIMFRLPVASLTFRHGLQRPLVDVRLRGFLKSPLSFPCPQVRSLDGVLAVRPLGSVVSESDKWATVPNALTAARLLVIPGFLGAWYTGEPGIAAGLFCGAAVTDFLDGYLARRWSQQSALGSLLDPLADKLLVAAALFVLVEHGGNLAVTLPAVAILSRELAVSSLREWVQARWPGESGGVAVAWHGKVKTALQLFALQAMLVGVALPQVALPCRHEAQAAQSWGELVYMGGVGLLWMAAIASVASGSQYARVLLRK